MRASAQHSASLRAITARQLQALVRQRLPLWTKVQAQPKELTMVVLEEWHGLALPCAVSEGDAELSAVMKRESPRCLGTVEVLRDGRLMYTEWLAPSCNSSQPWAVRCRTRSRRFKRA